MTGPITKLAQRRGRNAAHARQPREANPYQHAIWRAEWFMGYDEVRDRLVAKGIWLTGLIPAMIKRNRGRS